MGEHFSELLSLGVLRGAADCGSVGDIHYDLVPKQGDWEAGVVVEWYRDDDDICGCDLIKTTDTNTNRNEVAR